MGRPSTFGWPMEHSGGITVEEVACESSLFPAIIELWRSESDTLGFMPLGGFEQAARGGCLLVAVDPERTFCGYILYRRTTRKQTAIAHLCTRSEFRGRGVARLLVDAVKHRSTDSYELRLRCRRDFTASELWSS